MTDYEKGVSEEFTVKSGDVVQLIREGEEGLWYVELCLEGRCSGQNFQRPQVKQSDFFYYYFFLGM